MFPVLEERNDHGKIDYYYLDQIEESLDYLQIISQQKNENLLAEETDFLVHLIKTLVYSRSKTGLDRQRMVVKNLFDYHYQEILEEQLFDRSIRNIFMALFIISIIVCSFLVYKRMALRAAIAREISKIEKLGLN